MIGVMRSLAEMVSVQALTAPLIGFPDTFVDEALGFAVGIAYTLAQCLNMAVLTSVAARQANNYAFGGSLDTQAQCGIVVALCIITVLSNLLGVKLYGELERIFKWFKLLMFLGLCTLMIAVKAGAGATNVPQPPIPHQTDYSFVPSWQPAGHASTSDVSDDRSGGLGVPGEPGKFVAVWTCMTLAMFPLAGGDQVLVAAGEARSPHRDLPKAARFVSSRWPTRSSPSVDKADAGCQMYLAPICLYVLSSFLIGLNVNYADPGLLNIWTEQSPQGSYSPFIIALRYTTIEFLPGFLNALFLMSAYTAGNTGLYAASRTAFALAQRWGGPRLRNSVGRTSNGNTPVVAILACASFSLLAFLGATSSRDASSNQPISTLSSSFTSLIGCVYAAECIAYIRFKRGLDRVMVGGVSWRDTRVYQHQHYRAHWQPYGAWFGLIGCVLITLSAGWAPIFIMVAGDGLATRKLLKSNSLLAADLVGAYSGVRFPGAFLSIVTAADESSPLFSWRSTYITKLRITHGCGDLEKLRRSTMSQKT